MDNEQIVTIKLKNIFSIVFLLLGIILFSFTINEITKLKKCMQHLTKTAILGYNILLIVSIIMITFPIIQWISNFHCDCNQINIYYRWVFLVISILLITASSMIISSFKKTQCKRTAFPITLLISNILLLIGLVIWILKVDYKVNIDGKLIKIIKNMK